MTSARSQRGYRYYYPANYEALAYPTEDPFNRPQTRHENQRSISENDSGRSEEARRYRVENRLGGVERFENGSYKILNRLQVNKRGALEDTLSANDRVVFPGPTSKGSSGFRPEIPEECKRKGFCENVPNYPTDYVKKLVAELGDEVNRFQMDSLDIEDVQIAQRLGGTGTDQEIELCNFTERILYPESAPDRDDKWYTVINKKEKPVQGFRAEMCDSASTQCSPIASIQKGYKSSCKQKYVYRMMEALDENGAHIQKALRLPSCCSCVITVNGDPFL